MIHLSKTILAEMDVLSRFSDDEVHPLKDARVQNERLWPRDDGVQYEVSTKSLSYGAGVFLYQWRHRLLARPRYGVTNAIF